MAFASLALQAFGMATSAVGAYSSERINQNNLNYAADTADVNAKISEISAQDALLKGQREKQNSQIRTAQLKGSQRARLAGSGVDLSSDTANNILSTSDYLGEIDANTIEANAVKSAWGYRMDANNYTNQGIMNRAGVSSNAASNAAGNSLITGATQVASSWYSLNKEGAFSNKPSGLNNKNMYDYDSNQSGNYA